MFKGYTLLTWFLVANLAFTGLLVSWLMKFTDNILKASAGQPRTARAPPQNPLLLFQGGALELIQPGESWPSGVQHEPQHARDHGGVELPLRDGADAAAGPRDHDRCARGPFRTGGKPAGGLSCGGRSSPRSRLALVSAAASHPRCFPNHIAASASVLLYYMDPSTLVADAARVAALNAATSMGGGGGSVAAAAHHSGGGAAGSGGAPAELSGVRVVDVPGRGGEAMLVGGGAGFGPGAGVIHQGAGYSGGSGPSTAAAAVGIGAATTAGGFVSSILSSAFGGGGGGDAEAGGGIKAVKGN